MEYGDDLAYVFVHYPIGSHRFPRSAAHAAECAAREGAFAAYAGELFSRQDSLGLKTWSSIAVEAGVADTVGFNQCVSNGEAFDRVEKGRDVGSLIGVTGTPTVIVNRWRLPTPPYSGFSDVIEGLLAGRAPFVSEENDVR